MKRLIVVVLALALCIAAASAVAAKGGATKIKSKVTLNYQETGTPPYDEASRFYGKAKGKKTTGVPGKVVKKCKKGRKVKVQPAVGKTKTDSTGNYEIAVSGNAAPGTYTAKVKKKKITYKGDKYVCKKAKKSLTVS